MLYLKKKASLNLVTFNIGDILFYIAQSHVFTVQLSSLLCVIKVTDLCACLN